MTTTDYTTTLLVNQSAEEVFNAINNVSGWWQGEIEGKSNKLNDEFSYRMGEFHFSKQKLVEIIPNKKIVWLVTESELNFIENKKEWNNTKIIFDIDPQNEKTKITFTHLGLVPEIECYSDCSNGWRMLIEQSLSSFIKTGKGKKVF